MKVRAVLCAASVAAACCAAAGSARAASAAPACCVRLSLDLRAYGVRGRGTIVVDVRDGRFVRRFALGPASEAEGWNGAAAWRSDATGMARVQGDRGERAEIAGWSRALLAALRGGAASALTASSQDTDRIAFSGFRRFGDLHVPSAIVSRSSANGTWTARVAHVAFITPGAATFAPPAPPHDAILTSPVTTVPFAIASGTPQIVVRVNGAALRMFLDSGGQNVITESAARRAGLRVVGRATVAGGGGVAPIRFAFARSVRVGGATLRHQPYIVLADAALFGADGIIGYELFARFAAKLDRLHGTVSLARSARAFGPARGATPFAFIDRQPEVPGALDGVAGVFTLDTGSSIPASVNAEFVAAHHLVRVLHAHRTVGGAGVGGRYRMYLVHGTALRLGNAVVTHPLLTLLQRPGVWNGPYAPIANVGWPILRRWTLVLDYPERSVQLRPPLTLPAGLQPGGQPR
ncbi:MAG TPA: pepsin/retropepsin-like aspartic protease family protein [Candidatus Baltobacteraceae bacterium]|nr:pepsin/retropepsin-like aspartic protease family protein [Candidatus Baltobacteraceae bacterium]